MAPYEIPEKAKGKSMAGARGKGPQQASGGEEDEKLRKAIALLLTHKADIEAGDMFGSPLWCRHVLVLGCADAASQWHSQHPNGPDFLG